MANRARQGDVYQKIIEEVVHASSNDFEESGVMGSTLQELQQVRIRHFRLVDTGGTHCQRRHQYDFLILDQHTLQKGSKATTTLFILFTHSQAGAAECAGRCSAAQQQQQQRATGGKRGLRIARLLGLPLLLAVFLCTARCRPKPRQESRFDSFGLARTSCDHILPSYASRVTMKDEMLT